jgi:hypothetical protein
MWEQWKYFSVNNFRLIYKVSIKSFPGHVVTLRCTSEEFQAWIIFQQDGAPPDITNLKARITDAFATITEDMLGNTWRKIDYRIDVLHAKISTCWKVLVCCKKNFLSWVTFWKKKVCIPRSFLVINVCNQGNTLCSSCII